MTKTDKVILPETDIDRSLQTKGAAAYKAVVDGAMAAEYDRDLEQSRLEYEKPFAQEKELEEKTARLNELNVELDLENGVFDIGDMDPYEDSAPEAGRVAEPGRVAETGNRSFRISVFR